MAPTRSVVACAVVAVVVVAVAPATSAEAASTQSQSCTDGGGVRWDAKVQWGSTYLADGVRMISLPYAGWTTTRPGTVPTDFRVATYDGAGRLQKSTTRTEKFGYQAGTRYRGVNPRDPVSAPGRSRVTVTLGVDGDGFGDCTMSFVQPSVAGAPATPTPTPPPPTPTPTPPAGLSLTPVDGGPGFYGRWSSNNLPDDPSFFPRAVWMEQGFNADRLASYGVNAIVNPVSGRSQNPAVRNLSALDDEVDMWAGPGDDPWTGSYPGQGSICRPDSGRCGYTVMKDHLTGVKAGEMRYANYGKGVGFWETDAEASRFVNEFQDVTSIDLYWGTDANICGAWEGAVLRGQPGRELTAAECRKPANYGLAVDRVRDLVRPLGSRPVYSYVELGHPGTDGLSMPLSKIRPAVWSSLIHGARGIVYFNHSFGGSCISQHVMDDCDPAIAQTVTKVNAEIASLAPVLNSPKVNGVTKSGEIDVLAKYDGRQVWVLSGSNRASGSTQGSVTVPGVGSGTAEVVGENRTVLVARGTITDTWADSTVVHIYRVIA